MATNTGLSTLLVSIAFSFLFIQVARCDTFALHFHSAFERRAEELGYSCRHDGLLVLSQTLAPGETYIFRDDTSYLLYTCGAVWGRNLAKFDGYSFDRDDRNLTLHWKVDSTGWYLSYDNAKFEKQADWEKY